MTTVEATTKQIFTLVASMAGTLVAIATIHATMVVPAILDAAQARAQVMMDHHKAEVEVARQQYATKSDVTAVLREMDTTRDNIKDSLSQIRAQLDRIEARAVPPK